MTNLRAARTTACFRNARTTVRRAGQVRGPPWSETRSVGRVVCVRVVLQAGSGADLDLDRGRGADAQAFTLASGDVTAMLQREHTAFALFLDHWAAESGTEAEAAAHRAEAAEHRAAADDLTTALNTALWREDLGHVCRVALGCSTRV